MEMPGRNGQISGADYSYSFNGMESDPEVSGDGNSYTTQFRQYDPRLGRWKSLDPLAGKFPWQSPYAAFDDNPNYYTDPLGLAAEGDVKPAGGMTRKQKRQIRRDMRKRKRVDKTFAQDIKKKKDDPKQDYLYKIDNNSPYVGIENAHVDPDDRKGHIDGQGDVVLVYKPRIDPTDNVQEKHNEKQQYRVYKVRFKYEPDSPASTIEYMHSDMVPGRGEDTFKPKPHDNPFIENGDADYTEIKGSFSRFVKFKPKKNTKFYSEDDEMTWSIKEPDKNKWDDYYISVSNDEQKIDAYQYQEKKTHPLFVRHYSYYLYIKVPIDGFMGTPNWKKAEIYREYEEKKDGFWKKKRKAKKFKYYHHWNK